LTKVRSVEWLTNLFSPNKSRHNSSSTDTSRSVQRSILQVLKCQLWPDWENFRHMGEFSSIVSIVALWAIIHFGHFLKITYLQMFHIFLGNFFHINSCIVIIKKYGLDFILGNFFTKSSGHLVCGQLYIRTYIYVCTTVSRNETHVKQWLQNHISIHMHTYINISWSTGHIPNDL
jgi:hypothetical protein